MADNFDPDAYLEKNAGSAPGIFNPDDYIKSNGGGAPPEDDMLSNAKDAGSGLLSLLVSAGRNVPGVDALSAGVNTSQDLLQDPSKIADILKVLKQNYGLAQLTGNQVEQKNPIMSGVGKGISDVAQYTTGMKALGPASTAGKILTGGGLSGALAAKNNLGPVGIGLSALGGGAGEAAAPALQAILEKYAPGLAQSLYANATGLNKNPAIQDQVAKTALDQGWTGGLKSIYNKAGEGIGNAADKLKELISASADQPISTEAAQKNLADLAASRGTAYGPKSGRAAQIIRDIGEQFKGESPENVGEAQQGKQDIYQTLKKYYNQASNPRVVMNPTTSSVAEEEANAAIAKGLKQAVHQAVPEAQGLDQLQSAGSSLQKAVLNKLGSGGGYFHRILPYAMGGIGYHFGGPEVGAAATILPMLAQSPATATYMAALLNKSPGLANLLKYITPAVSAQQGE